MKTRFFHKWERTPEARAVSAATRELVRAILNIAGQAHHRYTTDERRCVAVVWAGQRKVAERLGLSVHGVKQRMRVATRAGLIARTRRAYGRSSLTVLELVLPVPTPESVPNAGQSDGTGFQRETESDPTVGQSSIPESDRVQRDISHAAVGKSAAADSYTYHTDESAKGLSPSSGSKDTDTATTDEPTFAQKGKVRKALIQLGVTPNAAVKMQGSTDHRILAAIVTVAALLKEQRSTSSEFFKSKQATGAWIGSLVFKGKPFGAWIRKELEGDDRADKALDVLDDACMIAEQEYPD